MNKLYMPQVDEKSEAELDDIFRKARAAVAEGTPHQPMIGLLTPGRILVTLGGVPRNQIGMGQKAMLDGIVGGDTPKTITVIAMTDVIGPAQTAQKGGLFGSFRRAIGGKQDTPQVAPRDAAVKKIPFLGILFAISGLGHNVVAFEGHRSALRAGCKDVDLVMIDEAMLDHLPSDWNGIVTNAIKPEGVILVVNRNGSITTYGRTGMPAPSNTENGVSITPVDDFPALVREARQQSNSRQITVISADRQLLPMELKADAELPPHRVATLELFIGALEPQAITVVTPMNIQSEAILQGNPSKQQITMRLAQAAPFVGHVAPDFAVLGHSVVAFEGNPMDLAEGCRDANVVLVDENMGQALLLGWVDKVKEVMAGQKRVLIFRKNGNVEMVN